MMKEYEFIFAKKLQCELSERISGGVKTWIVDDVLHISILKREYGMIFETSNPNFSELILNGLTVDYTAYDFVKKYRSFIMKQFFK